MSLATVSWSAANVSVCVSVSVILHRIIVTSTRYANSCFVERISAASFDVSICVQYTIKFYAFCIPYSFNLTFYWQSTGNWWILCRKKSGVLKKGRHNRRCLMCSDEMHSDVPIQWLVNITDDHMNQSTFLFSTCTFPLFCVSPCWIWRKQKLIVLQQIVFNIAYYIKKYCFSHLAADLCSP